MLMEKRRGLLGVLLVVLLSGALAACVDEGKSDKEEVAATYQSAEGWDFLYLSEAVESQHPYADRLEESHTVYAPKGASQMRVLFDHIAVEEGYDEVRLYDGHQNLIQTYTGYFRGWSPVLEGDTATIVLSADRSVRGFGFRAPAIQFHQESRDGQWVPHRVSEDAAVDVPHPYSNDLRKKWTIRGPEDARAIRVNFSQFSTERGYDFVHVYDGAGVHAASYTGDRGDFTSADVAGNTITVELSTDYSVTDYGFDLHGFEVLMADENSGCQSDRDCGEDQVCQSVQCIRAPCPALCVPAEPDPVDDGSCETNDECGEGYFCESVRCIQAPCPGRCVLFPETDLAGPAGRCGEGALCARGLSCVDDLASPGDGVCASARWAEEVPLRASVESAHPYADNTDRLFDVYLPTWAEQYSLDLRDFALEEGYDHLYFFADGADHNDLEAATASWTGNLGDFTTDTFSGNYGVLRLVTDRSISGHGFSVESAAVYGLPESLVSVTYDPQQCVEENNPKTEEEVVSFLNARGMTVYGIRGYQAHEIVCRACQCPAGPRYVVALRPEDAAQFMTDTPLLHRGVWRSSDVYQPRLEVSSFTYQPTQCRSNPWDFWASESGLGEASEALVLSEYFADQFGVSTLFTWSEAGAGFVCQACSCPRGDTLHAVLEVGSEQSEALEAAGWVKD